MKVPLFRRFLERTGLPADTGLEQVVAVVQAITWQCATWRNSAAQRRNPQLRVEESITAAVGSVLRPTA